MRTRVNAQARLRLRHPYPFKDYGDDRKIHQNMVGFLHDIWRGAPKKSFFFLATSDPDGKGWREHVVNASKTKTGVNKFLKTHSRWDYNLYFCPNPFSKPRRQKAFALPSRLGWCDMDGSDPNAYRPVANHLWETSPKRYQGLWLWDARHDIKEAEGFSQALADRHGGDSGWTITKMLRIPGSLNHKPQYDEPFVRMVSQNWGKVTERPIQTSTNARRHEAEPPTLDMNPDAHDRLAVLNKYRSKLGDSARSVMRHDRVIANDRSRWIFVMVADLHEVGASIDEIASVVWTSPYFREKYGDNRNALETEVSRIIAKTGGHHG